MKQTTKDQLPVRLSAEELEQLRELVISLHEGNGGAIPHASLVSLAANASNGTVFTVDFQAAESLGLPMIVLQAANEASNDARLKSLSPRERSVATLIALGLANKEIAGRLGLSLLTVKDHVHRILVKTGLPNRAAVAAACHGHLTEDNP